MKINRAYLTGLLLLTAGASLTAQNHRGKLPANGSVINDENGKEVFVSYALRVERDAVSPCRTLYITPQLASKSEVLSFPPVVIKGRARNQAYERWLALNGRQKHEMYPVPHSELTVDSHRDREIDFSTAVAWEPWMDGAELRFEERVFNCGAEEALYFRSLAKMEERAESEPELEAAPVSVTRRSARSEKAGEKNSQKKVLQEIEYQKKEYPEKDYQEMEGVAYIAFEQGKSIIRPMYNGNREELGNIAEVIHSLEEDETVRIVGLTLTGYASPEGSEVANYALSRKRTEAVMEYINEEFELWLPQKRMKTSSEGEDWEGLKDLLEESYIPYKREVMNIIDSRMNADEKEHRLRQIAGGEVYRILLEDFFPKLRRTRYVIQYQVKE